MPTLARSVLVAYAVVEYLCVAGLVARVWRQIGYCPVTVFKYRRFSEIAGATGFFCYPVLMIAATYFPEPPIFWRLEALHEAGVQLVGATLLALATVLYVVSVWTLGTSWRIGLDPLSQGPLITSGIYRVIRHPIYASLLVVLVGGFLTYACAFSAAAAVAGLPVIVLVVRREQKFLVERFGDAYRRYAEGTGELFPRL